MVRGKGVGEETDNGLFWNNNESKVRFLDLEYGFGRGEGVLVVVVVVAGVVVVLLLLLLMAMFLLRFNKRSRIDERPYFVGLPVFFFQDSTVERQDMSRSHDECITHAITHTHTQQTTLNPQSDCSGSVGDGCGML